MDSPIKKIEELKDDIDGIRLERDYGDDYRGWYFTKKIVRKESLPLNYKSSDLTYVFNICDFNFHFVMPAKFEFSGGMVAYDKGDRLLGVFRFPRDENGKFVAPYPLSKINKDLTSLTEEDIRKLLAMNKPLVFEAWRIPQFGFEYFDISDFNIKEISDITDIHFAELIKKEHWQIVKDKIDEVKNKIKSIPNFLLILRNVLDYEWRDLNEVSFATDSIIHI